MTVTSSTSDPDGPAAVAALHAQTVAANTRAYTEQVQANARAYDRLLAENENTLNACLAQLGVAPGQVAPTAPEPAVRPLRSVPASGGRTLFDPRTEEPPLPAHPGKGHTEIERKMAYLTYLGGVLLINREQQRGATAAEVAMLARRAGYKSGAAVNGFSINGASTESRPDGRWVTDSGASWIGDLCTELNLELPDAGGRQQGGDGA